MEQGIALTEQLRVNIFVCFVQQCLYFIAYVVASMMYPLCLFSIDRLTSFITSWIWSGYVHLGCRRFYGYVRAPQNLSTPFLCRRCLRNPGTQGYISLWILFPLLVIPWTSGYPRIPEKNRYCSGISHNSRYLKCSVSVLSSSSTSFFTARFLDCQIASFS